ncbi:MAG: sterol desaturase family protein [Bacteroidia bacterium]|nr:sterol desaturase family protein [Bacteroidia bacterium]
MEKYWDIFINGYTGYAGYLWHEITHPAVHNYFYWLIVVSLFFFALEWLRPWRETQPRFRKDFWLDFFYMFFNFFLFSLIIYNAASDVVVNLFKDLLALVGINNLVAVKVQSWPVWTHLLLGFVVRDFVQWWVHRLLHRVSFLWEFHKVHHSVEQMGFAAHLRYHWMENVVYRSIEYIPLALIGIGLNDFFIIHIFTLAIGHYNHSNITVSGKVSGAVVGGLVGLWIASINAAALEAASLPMWISYVLAIAGGGFVGAFALGRFMKMVFNSPEMHIWHHAYEIPADKPYGINFGISLAIWDYIFKTDYIPYSGKDIKLGFPGMEKFPHTFIGQNLHGLGKGKDE